MSLESSTVSSDEFQEAFDFARQALQHVGQFKTPPTPEVFEVWYRFAEGGNAPISEQLSHMIDQEVPITKQQIVELHDQFCQNSGDDMNSKISSRLESEMRGLESAIAKQVEAGEQFGASIERAGEKMALDPVTAAQVSGSVSELVASNQQMQLQLENLNSRLDHSQNQIARLKTDLVESRKKSMTDPLTGVGNRRCFDALLATALEDRETGNAGQAVLALIDLDNFKEVNDTLGHAVGDSLLTKVAKQLQGLRSDGMIARYGGDEFGVFIKIVQASDMMRFAEEARAAVTCSPDQGSENTDGMDRVTVSIGIARLREADTAESWFDRADKLLYAAKQAGRNCFRIEYQADG